MLVNLIVENWKSYKDRAGLSMMGPDAFRDEDLEERTPVFKRLGIKVAPVAAIWGGNAAGKSNLFEALSFVRDCVVGDPEGGGNLSGAEPYRLDPEMVGKAIRLQVHFVSNEKLYDLSFAVRDGCVAEEKLVRHTKSSEFLLYEREGGGFRFGKSQENMDRLNAAAEATRDDALFLNTCSRLGIDNYRDASRWFEQDLIMVPSDGRSGIRMLLEDAGIYSVMQEILPVLGTGISRISMEKQPIGTLSLPRAVVEELDEKVGEGEHHELPAPYASLGSGLVTREGGELMVKHVIPYYWRDEAREEGGELEGEVRMNLERESNGTLRLVSVLSHLILLARRGSRHVVFIDEFDRSLHTNLVHDLLEKYLGSCTRSSRCQLVLTAHTTRLMEVYVFGREEMWVTEKDMDGRSSLIRISHYSDIDEDRDIGGYYLHGHLRGTPQFTYERGWIPAA